jgi:uncharacterized protein (TIGR03067 family)
MDGPTAVIIVLSDQTIHDQPFKDTMKTILGFCVLFAAALPAFADETSDDQKALEGVWVPVKAELGGQPMPDAVLKTITLKIDKDGYEVTQGENHSDKGTCALDVAAKPKGMKIVSVEGANAGKTFLAIYELKDDTLRVCYDLSGTKRPTEFKTSPGTPLYLATYHRKKK